MLEVFQDVWFDNGETDILKELNIETQGYFLVSIHRDENTEIESNFTELLNTLNGIADKYNKPIIVSTHPRTKAKLDKTDFNLSDKIVFHKPFGFFDYLTLQMNAMCVISDSGTISEESTLLGFPAITIRNAIERPEALDVGGILMTGVNKENILNYIDIAMDEVNITAPYGAPKDYVVSNFSERVLKIILGYTPYVNKYIWHKVKQ
jgi:UDP-N-acetylglucosamine 2-epimerase (non-hydrolysing)